MYMVEAYVFKQCVEWPTQLIN